MKKKVRLFVSMFLVGVLLMGFLTGCSTSVSSGNGNSFGNIGNYASEGIATPSSDAEKDSLLYMAEEEKLARDVYTYLNKLWGMQVFENIAEAEQTHMDSVLSVINNHNLEIPAISNTPGEFNNPELQALYDQLTTTGAKSIVDALKVGAAIEEIDIIDLDDYLKVVTSQDIINVYENLKNGSESHLRAFVSQLENYGITYTPQYLSVEEYNAIINASNNNKQGNTGPSNANGNNNGGGKSTNGGNGSGGN
ncbi:MAG: DUF2202 domain-containing protein [Bacteroidales bacterium]|nr:DUF2202 domain-containing protein [Bacteroidales bacterium]